MKALFMRNLIALSAKALALRRGGVRIVGKIMIVEDIPRFPFAQHGRAKQCD